MSIHHIGIIMNGVTGRMGTNQHLIRSILAIRKQGGVKIKNNEIIMPEPVLVGRNEEKLKKLADTYGVTAISTDLEKTLKDPNYQIYFDSQTTNRRVNSVLQAINAGKAIYCEKPIADNLDDAVKLYQTAGKAGVKNGVVQDKLFLPGLLKYQELKRGSLLGRILSVRGEFGYWVFSGFNPAQPPQRPSWNYRKEDGGGIVLDMYCHWRYVLDNLFGGLKSVITYADTHLQERVDENGLAYSCSADDAAYSIFLTHENIVCQFNSSWTSRVRRDDLLTILVDGTEASAKIGLRKCWLQTSEKTPRFVWNPDVVNPIDFYENWEEVLPDKEYDNGFKSQWELFLKHVVLDEPFPWTLKEGAKGIQLAEKSWLSHERRSWVNLSALPD